MEEALENAELKRNPIDISFVFWQMGHLGTNEIFSIKPFAVFSVGDVFQEKFVRAGHTSTKFRFAGGSGEIGDSKIRFRVVLSDDGTSP
jgi:hypothetical protein